MLNSVFPIRQIEPNQSKSRRAWSGSSMILCFVMRPKTANNGQSDTIRKTNDGQSVFFHTSRTPLVLNSVFPIRQIEPNQSKSRRAWSGSSMILCFVLLGMKRVRLAKSDDQDSFNSEANSGEQSLENRRPRRKMVSPVPSFFMLFYLYRLVIYLILG